jgi:hemerythrin-like domain-containing protein
MTATEILKQEHQTILLVIAAMEREAASIGKTGKIHTRTVREMVDFLKNFVGRRHHWKEEKHLFVIIHRRGMPMETGPLAGMLHEHEQGRAYVRVIAEAVAGKGRLDAATIQKVRRNLAACAHLLRTHIDKEDNVLYPMADRILDIHDQKMLCDAFDKIEADEKAKGVYEKYHSWIEKLVGSQDEGEVSNRKQTKDADDKPFEPTIVMADKALADGSADEMIKKISGYLASAVKNKFNKAVAAQKNKDKSVEAGREFVEAYVNYMHYIEGIRTAIMSADGHHHTEAAFRTVRSPSSFPKIIPPR